MGEVANGRESLGDSRIPAREYRTSCGDRRHPPDVERRARPYAGRRAQRFRARRSARVTQVGAGSVRSQAGMPGAASPEDTGEAEEDLARLLPLTADRWPKLRSTTSLEWVKPRDRP